MKKLIVWAVLSAAVAVLPSCGDDEGEGCSTPVISEVNYSPKNPSKSEEVTVTARIRNEHCPFQACVTYQVDLITGTWGNTTESYRSTDPVYSTVAGETYDFMAKIASMSLLISRSTSCPVRSSPIPTSRAIPARATVRKNSGE